MGWKAGRESGVKKREGSWGREIEEKVGQGRAGLSTFEFPKYLDPTSKVAKIYLDFFP